MLTVGSDSIPSTTRLGTSPDRHMTAWAICKLCELARVPALTSGFDIRGIDIDDGEFRTARR